MLRVWGLGDPCGAPGAGDVKEFGFRGVPSGPVPPEAELPPLQPVPVLAPGMVADPRLALTIGVSGSIANAQVQRLAGTQNDYSYRLSCQQAVSGFVMVLICCEQCIGFRR